MQQEQFQNFSCAETRRLRLIAQRNHNSLPFEVVQPHDPSSIPAPQPRSGTGGYGSVADGSGPLRFLADARCRIRWSSIGVGAYLVLDKINRLRWSIGKH